MIEKAVHIPSAGFLTPDNIRGFQRIYWGPEFCQNLIPSRADTEKALLFSREHGLAFTLVTPFVTGKGMARLQRLFDLLAADRSGCEVVVNDWGVLHALLSRRQKRLQPVLGRLLTRQQREPSLGALKKPRPPLAVRRKDGTVMVIGHRVPCPGFDRAAQSSFTGATAARAFLRKRGIDRAEYNNVRQGVLVPGHGFKATLYLPYVHVSTTRYCPMLTRSQRMSRLSGCRRECAGFWDELRAPGQEQALLRLGNSIFYYNGRVPASGKGRVFFDRILDQRLFFKR